MLISNSVSKQPIKSLVLAKTGGPGAGSASAVLPADRLGQRCQGNTTRKELEKPRVAWKENGHSLGSRWVLYREQLHSNRQCHRMLPECLLVPCPAQGSRPGTPNATAALALPSQGTAESALPRPKLVLALIPS